MRILSKNDLMVNRSKIVAEIKQGAVFIYPTDTIYGVGCDATNDVSVRKIRALKGRDAKPFSVIAPSIDWIHDNCELSDKAKAWLVKLPGPYTLILNLKNSGAVCAQTNMGMKTIGVRIPNHWIASLISDVGKPVITTSVNLAGSPPAGTREQLEKFVVDFIIYEGDRQGRPSTVVDLTKDGKVLRQ
jgi:tRNA threonylcarbamoyl adenosine modification protein (Sua5/YciO/YrdC/YwlC family)